MAKVFIEETTLTAIGDAIRGKEGTTELVPVNDMATRITSLPSGGGGDLPDEAFIITGDCRYRFASSGWNWFLNQYRNQLTTNNITNAEKMFDSNPSTEFFDTPINIRVSSSTSFINMFAYCNNVVKIPDIYIDRSGYSGNVSMGSMFTSCYKLTTLPYIYNATPSSLGYFLSSCQRLRTIPEDWIDTWDTSMVSMTSTLFNSCYSLRQIPNSILQKLNNCKWLSANYVYNSLFTACYTLDKIENLFVAANKSYTSNMFSTAFDECRRLKNITFETNADGTPKTANWKSQTISLTKYVGWSGIGSNSDSYILNYNSGITADKWVKDDTTYQALKNDPDAYATAPNWSRYDHDSAVRTINSLPDTSAYLAANGGTNTIKFEADSGSETDAGAISTLTEAEIAVAAAKGWTVTLV